MTDHPNSVAYCDQNTRAHSPGGQKSEIQVLQGHGPFEGSREASLSCLFQPLVGPGIIPQPALCLRPPREPPPPQCLRVAFPSLFLREVLMTAFQAHLDDPRLSPHLENLHIIISARKLFPGNIYLHVGVLGGHYSVCDAALGQVFLENSCQDSVVTPPLKTSHDSSRSLPISAPLSSFLWTRYLSFLQTLSIFLPLGFRTSIPLPRE